MTVDRTLYGNNWRLASATFETAATFDVTANDTTTKPTGDVIDYGTGVDGSSLLIKAVGTDAADESFSFRIWGWRKIGSGASAVWSNVLLGEYTATLGTATATNIASGALYADAITKVTGAASDEIVSPGANLCAYLNMDPRGCELVEFDFDMTGAASANLLYCTL